MKIIKLAILMLLIVIILSFSSFFYSKSVASKAANLYGEKLSFVASNLVLFGGDPYAPSWVYRWEYNNIMTGATFDVYVSFFGNIKYQSSLAF